MSELLEAFRATGPIWDATEFEKRLLAIEAQSKLSPWIPCSERLPEHARYVLVSTKWGFVGQAEVVLSADPPQWYWIHATRPMQSPPIAWMPMPDPMPLPERPQ